jgi:hypothetical protein
MLRGTVSLVVALGLATAACTVVSGVDDLELRTSSSPVAPTPSPDAGSDPSPFASDASTPDTSTAIKAPSTGPSTCGAQGSWSSCTVPSAFTSCATICQAQGFSCVDSCCANDSLGDYAAKVGMVYALTAECSLPSITSQASFGLCADALVLPAGFGDVRCCCK